ncbi:phage scaffolding protein [Anaeromicrobium sediminis]|uniref:Scaffolding protein n=1 Tax=Anaeromicrobium sediminis TaxID=1478221 RepID=A0A267MP61_9FIRM|nr:hypothetical protein [Anaeromicrobium sediminis]PAB61326.1 hypothetical protein CCE28_02525 [Anaeromicrobium sediminis]
MKKRLFDINLQLFADEGNEPSGGDGKEPGNNGGNEPVGDNKTYTQEELDKMLKKEKGKVKKFATDELLKELGIENTEALKSIIEAKKADDEKNKTDLEKLQEQLNNITKEKDAVAEKAKTTLITAEFKVKAIGEGLDVKQIDAALKLADLSEIEVKEDGAVEGIEDVIKKVIEDYPFLIGQINSNVGNGGGNNPGTNNNTSKSIGERLAAKRKTVNENQTKGQNHYF